MADATTSLAPGLRATRLLDDGALVIDDIRCSADPAERSGLERSVRTEAVIPLAGVFLRTVRGPRAEGGPSRVFETLIDPVSAAVFPIDETYRITHPIGGGDRSIVIGIEDGEAEAMLLAVGSAGGRRAVALSPATAVLARRLAASLASGFVDALGGAEVALAIVDSIAGMTRPSCGGPEPQEVLETRLAIAAEPGTSPTLPELGRRVGRSGFELARRFRRATGTSIHRYRTAVRAQAALERIEAGERDLTGLALDLGFADHSHLTNVLRREAGAPPSAFRRAATGQELAALRTILQA